MALAGTASVGAPPRRQMLDRLRDRRTDAAAGVPGTADSFEALLGEEFALLVTFRRSGEPVPTQVWFGMHDGRLDVESLADAGKVKRLRNDPRLPGRSVHRSRQAERLVRRWRGPNPRGSGGEERRVSARTLDRHYGLRRRLYMRLGTRLGVRSVYLELTPTGLNRA
jgi:uncharacterized protein